MPRENKKVRTRRNKPAKNTDAENHEDRAQKRRRIDEEASPPNVHPDQPADQEVWQNYGEDYAPQERSNASGVTFFGFLTDDEHSLIGRANERFDANDFANEDERDVAIDDFYEHFRGKAIKIACSQSCSRFFEKLIRVSKPEHLRALHSEFQGHFLDLIQHRFASHTCEILFRMCASEIENAQRKHTPKNHNQSDSSMEDLFLQILDELEGNFSFLMANKYGSHTLRELLAILQGKPASKDSEASKFPVTSKSRPNMSIQVEKEDTQEQTKTAPQIFKLVSGKILDEFLSGLDTTSVRSLSLHPCASPVLQSLLDFESLTSGRSKKESRTLLKLFIPETKVERDSESFKFLSGILYDPVGSRLLEQLLISANGKLFKSIFGEIIRPRISDLVRNDIASYVAITSLERLGKDDLATVLNELLPAMSDQSRRPQNIVLRKLVDRSISRGIDMEALRSAFLSSYGSDFPDFLYNLLGCSTAELADKSKRLAPQVVHASLLAQSMIEAPQPVSGLIFTSIEQLTQNELFVFASNAISSRVFQKAITAANASTIFRRKAVNGLIDQLNNLAHESSGAHVLDALWLATSSIFNLRERIAETLLGEEAAIRGAKTGWVIWRNWDMDTYKHARSRWVSKNKGSKTIPLAANGAHHNHHSFS